MAGPRCSPFSRAPAEALGVVDALLLDGNVDGVATGAANTDLAVHVLGGHRRGQDVAAFHADVVVGAVAAKYRLFDVLLHCGPTVDRNLALLRAPHRLGGDRVHSVASFPVKSLIIASSTVTITPSPIDAALPLICAAV